MGKASKPQDEALLAMQLRLQREMKIVLLGRSASRERNWFYAEPYDGYVIPVTVRDSSSLSVLGQCLQFDLKTLDAEGIQQAFTQVKKAMGQPSATDPIGLLVSYDYGAAETKNPTGIVISEALLQDESVKQQVAQALAPAFVAQSRRVASALRP